MLDGGGNVVSGSVMGGRGCDVTDNVGRIWCRTIDSWDVASSLQRPPVGGGGKAVVGGVMREVGGMRRGRDRGQVSSCRRGFIRQVQQ